MTLSVTVFDLIFEYGGGHFIPTALAIERAVRYTGAEYIAITEAQCPQSAQTNHWLRILPPFRQNNKIADWRAPLVLFRILLEISLLAWILYRQLAKISRSYDRVVIRLDWFVTRQLIAVALALTSFKLVNFVRSAFYGPTEPMLWIHIHEKHQLIRPRTYYNAAIDRISCPNAH